MADKKISQLTGASTPLAGTEVLPIVQSGSTVKVASNDLTVKNVRSNATTGILQVVGPAAASTRVMTTPDANFTVARTDAGQTFTGNNNVDGLLSVNTGPNTDGQIRIYNTTTRVLGAKYGVRFADSSFETNGSIYIEQAASGNNSAEMAFVANAGTGGIQITSGQEFLRGYGNGDAKIPAGNLVVGTAAKGIDFSANTHAAGMTSELLNWYEEGTWTPTYDTTGNNFTTMTMDVISATYTRIGRQVTVRAFIRTDNVDTTGATGNLRISGLPFTSAANGYSAIAIGFATEWAGNTPLCGYVNDNSTSINLLYRSSVTGATASCVPADMTTGANADKNTLIFSATYFV
jgi:hypothetical protein